MPSPQPLSRLLGLAQRARWLVFLVLVLVVVGAFWWLRGDTTAAADLIPAGAGSGGSITSQPSVPSPAGPEPEESAGPPAAGGNPQPPAPPAPAPAKPAANTGGQHPTSRGGVVNPSSPDLERSTPSNSGRDDSGRGGTSINIGVGGNGGSSGDVGGSGAYSGAVLDELPDDDPAAGGQSEGGDGKSGSVRVDGVSSGGTGDSR